MTTTIERITAIINEDKQKHAAEIEALKAENDELKRQGFRASWSPAAQIVEPTQEVADLAAQLRDVIDDSKRATARQMTLIERLREQKDKAHKLVAEQETIIDERDKQIEDLQVRLELKAAAAESRDEIYRGLIHERDRIIDSNDARIGGMVKELRRRDAVIVDLNRLLDESHAENARLVLQIAEVEAREEKNIVDMQETIRTLNARSAYHATEIRLHNERLKNYVEKVDRAMGGIGCRSPEDVIAAAATMRTLVIEHQQNCAQWVPAAKAKPTGGAGCIFPECGPTCQKDCGMPGPEPAADVVKEQGPWIVFEGSRARADVGFMGWNGWRPSIAEVAPFDLKSDAVVALEGWRMGGYSNDSACVMTVDQARAIEAKKPTGV
jgi:hypothetical protein